MKLNLNPKAKKILWGVFAVVFVVSFGLWMLLNPAPEHIEDTNGPDNYRLQTITDRDIAKQEMGARGGLTTEKNYNINIGGISISDGISYSCKKFTGVQQLYACTLFKGSDILVDLAGYQIKSGNFAFCIVFDGEVVGKIYPDEFGTGTFLLENVPKTAALEYVIAGENASFSFVVTEDWENGF